MSAAPEIIAPPTVEEELDGVERPEDVQLGDYPLDAVLIRPETRTVHDILRKIDTTYVLDPEFQRDFVWSEDRQSRLIESVLMRIPLPTFYLAENEEGKQIVVDGLQRLSTFQRFANNELALSLKNRTELNGKRFRDLTPKLQNRVEDCNLTLYILDPKVAEQAKLDIFERVNSGVPLTRQQMRNSLYTGKATRFLKEESRSKEFFEATDKSIRTDTMRDRELVNRFCAFHLLNLDRYQRDDLDDFLAQALTEMNRKTDRDLEALSLVFRGSLRANYFLFGRFAFRKPSASQDFRSPINVSLWDSLAVALAGRDPKEVEDQVDDLRSAFQDLMTDEEFVGAITRGTTDKRRVRYRIERAREVFDRVLGC